MVNFTLWFVQIFLAIFFTGAAIPKITGRGIEQWTGFAELPRPLVVSIGFAEIAGALGLALPMATGILPWLTPFAAIGLSVNVLMATGFHVRSNERLNAIETTLWATIAAIVAIGRWSLVPSRIEIAPNALAAALMVLLPLAIINVIILLRRPVNARAS